MPSLHEGQPMAILEARMLKMPIIVSNFSTVTDSLYENGQLLINMDIDSIYEGMKSYINGQVPNDFIFDSDAYNQKALEEFEKNLIF
jgi:glycosyltransferase involved in cell wall biosynthesis